VWQVVSNKFLVSNETVVLCRWERSKQKFGFIKGANKGRITTAKDSESRRLERQPLVRANRGIVGCCGLYESVEELCHW